MAMRTRGERPGPVVIVARVLAVIGVVLVGGVLAAPIVLLMVGAAMRGGLHLDYLLPGELVAIVAVGGVALVVAAYLARRSRLAITVSAVLAGVMFAVVTWVATATGLGDGDRSATGWRLTLVVTAYAGYVAAVAALFAFGIGLARAAFRRAGEATWAPSRG
ncbi:hypothetical protein [Pseudolysinimonas sp.]|uniref:hypothetical protein n=1 Tax=Pseudolysinimonas sp. TaxID=2680009 RepID=UPI003F80AA49